MGDELFPELSLTSTVAEWLGHPVAGPALAEELARSSDGPRAGLQAEMLQMVGSMPMRRFVVVDMGADIPVGLLERLVGEAARARATRTG